MPSNFPGGFPGGLNVQGVPIVITKSANIFWVDSVAGVDTSNDGTFDRPWATIDYASSKCTDSVGDIIVCKAGHAESIASATAANLAKIGVQLIGMGIGTNRPTLTFTSTGGKVTVDAANILIHNIRFVPGGAADGQVVMLDINAAGCKVTGCDFPITTSQPTTVITVAASADRTTISGNKITSPSAGTVKGIWLEGVVDNVTIEDNDIEGDFSSAPIGVAEVIATKLIIRRNNVGNTDAVGHGIIMASSTGVCADNTIYSPSAAYATSVLGTSMRYKENYASSSLGVSAVLVKSGAAA